jgi:hypothetical protein
MHQFRVVLIAMRATIAIRPMNVMDAMQMITIKPIIRLISRRNSLLIVNNAIQQVFGILPHLIMMDNISPYIVENTRENGTSAAIAMITPLIMQYLIA